MRVLLKSPYFRGKTPAIPRKKGCTCRNAQVVLCGLCEGTGERVDYIHQEAEVCSPSVHFQEPPRFLFVTHLYYSDLICPTKLPAKDPPVGFCSTGLSGAGLSSTGLSIEQTLHSNRFPIAAHASASRATHIESTAPHQQIQQKTPHLSIRGLSQK